MITYVKIALSPTLNTKSLITLSLRSFQIPLFRSISSPGPMCSTSCQAALLPTCPQPLQQRMAKSRVSNAVSFRACGSHLSTFLKSHFRSLDLNSCASLPPQDLNPLPCLLSFLPNQSAHPTVFRLSTFSHCKNQLDFPTLPKTCHQHITQQLRTSYNLEWLT